MFGFNFLSFLNVAFVKSLLNIKDASLEFLGEHKHLYIDPVPIMQFLGTIIYSLMFMKWVPTFQGVSSKLHEIL